MTQLTSYNMESLVQQITDQVLQAMNGQSNGLGAACSGCDTCKGNCAGNCPDVVRQVLDSGASRISTRLGVQNVAADIARTIDHTLLKPDATEPQIRQLCAEALEYTFASVCVNPTWVPLCAEILRGSDEEFTAKARRSQRDAKEEEEIEVKSPVLMRKKDKHKQWFISTKDFSKIFRRTSVEVRRNGALVFSRVARGARSGMILVLGFFKVTRGSVFDSRKPPHHHFFCFCLCFCPFFSVFLCLLCPTPFPSFRAKKLCLFLSPSVPFFFCWKGREKREEREGEERSAVIFLLGQIGGRTPRFKV